MNEILLTVRETAERLGLGAGTLNNWRVTGEGPPFLKLGGRVLYDPADLAAWLDERRRKSTGEGGMR